MRKNISKPESTRPVLKYYQKLRAHLTPQERKTLLLIVCLFALGAVVRWVRVAHLS